MDKKSNNINLTQIIMILFAFILIIFAIYKIYLDASSVNSDTLIYISAIIIIIASLNPSNLNKILLKTTNVELSLEKRHIPNEKEINFAYELDEKNFNVKDIENDSIYEEAINRGKNEKSDVDYLIIATKLWREKRYEKAIRNCYIGLYISKSNKIKSLLNMRIATIVQDMYINNYDIKFCEMQYKKALSYNTRNDKIYNNMAALYINNKDKNIDISYDDILNKINKAIGINPESFAAYRNLGVLYSMQNKFDESEKAYLKSIELKNDYIGPYNDLAKLYMQHEEKKDLNKAFKYLQKAIDIEPENLISNQLIGNYYYLKKEIDNSINHYLKLIRFDVFKELNDDIKSDIYHHIGVLYYTKDDFENALKYFNKAVAFNDKNAHAYDSMGELYIKIKDFEKAIQAYLNCIELNDPHTLNKSNIYNNLGYCYTATDDFENAKKYLDKSISLNKKNAHAYDSMGELYIKIKDFEKAKKYLRKAAKLDPKSFYDYKKKIKETKKKKLN